MLIVVGGSNCQATELYAKEIIEAYIASWYPAQAKEDKDNRPIPNLSLARKQKAKHMQAYFSLHIQADLTKCSIDIANENVLISNY